MPACHLPEEQDPFRDPAGQAMRDTLPVLLDAALGRIPVADATAHLERLMRIRAVQDLTPGQAVGFLFQLTPLPHDEAQQARVQSLVLAAFDLYVSCRDQMHAIQLKELRRNFEGRRA